MSADREARHLSGADIGRTLILPGIRGRIDSVTHLDDWVQITLDPPAETGVHTVRCLPNSIVTTEGENKS